MSTVARIWLLTHSLSMTFQVWSLVLFQLSSLPHHELHWHPVLGHCAGGEMYRISPEHIKRGNRRDEGNCLKDWFFSVLSLWWKREPFPLRIIISLWEYLHTFISSEQKLSKISYQHKTLLFLLTFRINIFQNNTFIRAYLVNIIYLGQ